MKRELPLLFRPGSVMCGTTPIDNKERVNRWRLKNALWRMVMARNGFERICASQDVRNIQGTRRLETIRHNPNPRYYIKPKSIVELLGEKDDGK